MYEYYYCIAMENWYHMYCTDPSLYKLHWTFSINKRKIGHLVPNIILYYSVHSISRCSYKFYLQAYVHILMYTVQKKQSNPRRIHVWKSISELKIKCRQYISQLPGLQREQGAIFPACQLTDINQRPVNSGWWGTNLITFPTLSAGEKKTENVINILKDRDKSHWWENCF